MFRSLPHRKHGLLLVSGLLALVMLAGCGAGTSSTASTSAPSSSSAPATITLWESQSNEPVASAMTAIVQQFNAAHPGQAVQLHIISQGTQVLAAVQAGNPPIMGEVNHYIAKFRNAGALKSFNPYINGSNGLTAAEQSQFYQSVWNDGVVNGQHYRLLVDTKVSELFYNKALFKQAGITSTPTTWAQLAQDVAILKQKLPGVTPMALDDSIGDIVPAFLSNGGQLYASGTQSKAAFQSSAANTTFNYFRQLYQNGDMIFSNTNGVRSLFAQGKLAIADQTSAGSLPLVNAVHGAFQVGAFAYPAGSSGHSANVLQGEGAILMNGYSQSQYQAAWAFMKFWLSPKEQAYWAVHSGYAPQTKAAIPYLTAQDYANNPGLAVSIQTLNSPYTIHRPGPDNYVQVEDALAASFFQAVTGQQSVSSALSTLQQQADGYLSGKSGI